MPYVQIHVERDDDDDTKDVLLAREEYYMRMLSTLYPFGLNDNVKSLIYKSQDLWFYAISLS